ncbi:MAG: hypothetical protein PHC28_13880 [Flavobacterium sp.]|uniref:hypothetical protein n=1 Tax=Flavobacterium sp. TaxID=239 RepID=UPI00263222E2|nr:hypothetical protein [Flavobacterium sp.]MDD5151543.1 hypothetical protein [Flavobacterium sp.]
MRNLISPIIIDNIPAFIKAEYPTATNLLIDYYKWLETENNFIDVLFNFSTNHEINDINCKYIDSILSDLGWNTIKTADFDKKILVNTLKDFYMSRGSLNGLRYLFRLLFNVDVNVTYPRDRWFSLSDAEYYNDTKILITSTNYDNLIFQELLHDSNLSAYIIGNNSGAQCLINKIDIIYGNLTYIELTINKPEKNFINESVSIHYKNRIFVETIYERPEIIIRNGGILYKVGEEISLSGYAVDGKITIKKVKKGSLSGVNIVSGGVNYSLGDIISTKNTIEGKAFLATVSKIDLNGTIQEINILNPGVGYIEIPELIVSSILGTGANIIGVTTTIGKILEIQHEYFYWDVVSSPTLVINTVTGTGANLFISNNVYINTNQSIHRDNLKFIGYNCYLHDGNKYNKFSYEIRSIIPLTKSKRHIFEHIHPSGVNLFNIRDLYFDTSIDNSIDTTLNNTTITKFILFSNSQYTSETAILADLQISSYIDITIQNSEELIIDNII